MPKDLQLALSSEENVINLLNRQKSNKHYDNHDKEFVRACYFPPDLSDNNKRKNSKLIIYHISIISDLQLINNQQNYLKSYQIYIEQRFINDNNIYTNQNQLPNFPVIPIFRKLPQLNLNLPTDIFYPFSCTNNANNNRIKFITQRYYILFFIFFCLLIKL